MKIRKATKKDIIPTSELVSKTFAKFNFKEGTKKGVKEYINFHDPRKNLEKIKEDFPKHKIFFVAEEKGKIIGVIRGDELKIINLFVEGKHHKKGIAKKLMKKFEETAKKIGSDRIKIRASLYSINFYIKMGYKKTTGIKEMYGIKIQPMMKKLK